jgi:glycosyltransferase involved in cell wall biosynthesis
VTRILLVTGIYPPDIGGPATFIPSLAKHLVNEKKMDVTVFTLHGNSRNKFENHWKVISIKRSLFRPLRVTYAIIRLLKLIQTSDYVFCNGLYIETGIALFFSRKKSIAKIVGDPVWERARNKGKTQLDVATFNQGKAKLAQNIERIIFQKSLNQFSRIICPSEELVHFVKEWNVATQVSCIPNFVEISERRHSTKDFDLITVSRLVSWKNIDVVIKLAGELNLRLAIVGSGPEESHLLKLSKELNVEATFFGALYGDSIDDLLLRSKIFILISDYEGMSFALLRALALGIPAMVSNNKGNTQVLENRKSGVVVEVKNFESMIGDLREMIENWDFLENLSENGRNLIKDKYSPAIIINKILDTFNEID